MRSFRHPNLLPLLASAVEDMRDATDGPASQAIYMLLPLYEVLVYISYLCIVVLVISSYFDNTIL